MWSNCHMYTHKMDFRHFSPSKHPIKPFLWPIIRSILLNQTCDTWDKVFKSAAPTQFWRYTQIKNCFETKMFKIGVYKIEYLLLSKFFLNFFTLCLRKVWFCIWFFLIHFCTTPISNFIVCWFQNSFCFGCTFKTELGPHFGCFCTSIWPYCP